MMALKTCSHRTNCEILHKNGPGKGKWQKWRVNDSGHEDFHCGMKPDFYSGRCKSGMDTFDRKGREKCWYEYSHW